MAQAVPAVLQSISGVLQQALAPIHHALIISAARAKVHTLELTAKYHCLVFCFI